MKKQVLAAIGILAITGSVQTAAASSSAQAIIDWDSLSFQLVDYSGGANVPTLTWTTKSGSASTFATTIDPDDSGSSLQQRNNFTSALSSGVDTQFAQGSATRNSHDGLVAQASSQQGLTPVSGVNKAEASVGNNGTFQLSGNGLLLISLDWSVYSSGSTGDLFWTNTGEWANATVNINASYSGQFTSGSANTNYSTTPFWFINAPETSQSSTFVLAIFNTGLETISGSITASAQAQAYSGAYNNAPIEPVPLPTSAWLFGSALFGLLVQRRRKVA